MSSKKGGGSSILQNIGSVLDPVTSYLGHLVAGKEKKWKHTTMGRMFQSPSAKMPESKGASSAQAVADAASEKSMMESKERERKRLRGAAGRRSLIATSGRGVLGEAPIKRKKLLGE